MEFLNRLVTRIGGLGRVKAVLPEPKRWQVGDVRYMQDTTGRYFALGGQVYCEHGPLADSVEGEAVLLAGLESQIIGRRMGGFR